MKTDNEGNSRLGMVGAMLSKAARAVGTFITPPPSTLVAKAPNPAAKAPLPIAPAPPVPVLASAPITPTVAPAASIAYVDQQVQLAEDLATRKQITDAYRVYNSAHGEEKTIQFNIIKATILAIEPEARRATLIKGLDDKIKNTLLIFASQNGEKNLVAALLTNLDFRVDPADINTKTPLIWAAENGHPEIVTLLLGRGADPSMATGPGFTALMLAAQNGHTSIVEQLITKSPDLNARNGDLKSALMLAAENGHTDVVTKLLTAGVDPALVDKAEKTAFLLAATNGHEHVVTQLLGSADLNLADRFGNTALMLAAENNRTNIMSILLQKNIDLDAQNNITGETALMIAAKKGQKEMVKLLLEKGADPRLQNRSGKTAADLAQEDGIKTILNLAIEERKNAFSLLKKIIDQKTKPGKTSTALPFADAEQLSRLLRIVDINKKTIHYFAKIKVNSLTPGQETIIAARIEKEFFKGFAAKLEEAQRVVTKHEKGKRPDKVIAEIEKVKLVLRDGTKAPTSEKDLKKEEKRAERIYNLLSGKPSLWQRVCARFGKKTHATEAPHTKMMKAAVKIARHITKKQAIGERAKTASSGQSGRSR